MRTTLWSSIRVGDENVASAGPGDGTETGSWRFSPGGRLDDLGNYRFVCPVPGCPWVHDENTTQENPGWRERVGAAIDAHLAAVHPHWIVE
ncbi:hypothetical protein OHB26_27795 [Nocardia sp. NBC_01503]|uniref:hypothetical protein n=1 Tax=Nocardia sp. NBC_01503 TaxID=2975997 RepID=UPI002E7AE7D5|nr:hypothetical protein [Nocardia sp. NBC_01503]WTL30713.1 hypothetical protein OHB26_27795 [Nocardia sp. NBC_01503]